jgi:hypothetical protein
MDVLHVSVSTYLSISLSIYIYLSASGGHDVDEDGRIDHDPWSLAATPTTVSDSVQVHPASHFLLHMCALSHISPPPVFLSISCSSRADAARSDLGAQHFYRDCSLTLGMF